MKIILLIFVTTFLLIPTFAQENANEASDPNQSAIDSQLNLVEQETQNVEKTKHYNEIAKIAGNSDTRLKYASMALDLCSETDLSPIAHACYNIGKAYYMLDGIGCGIDCRT